MNKLSKIIKYSLACLLTVGAVMTASGAGRVNALPYGSTGPENAVFNIYTGAPHGIGDESDFVRLRASTGSPTVSAVENDFVDPLNGVCEVGDRFDVRTYIHNGALADMNDDGNGPAVAHDVVLSMNAPLGQTGETFSFGSTVRSSNTPTVTDSGTLNCDDEVRLRLVPQTVYVYSMHYGWQNAADSAVNGSMPVGSQVFGASEVWGCWEQRVVVVYQVEVIAVPEQPREEPKDEPRDEEPVVLPVTGMGSLAGVFVATSAVGTLAHKFVISRRYR